MSKTFFGIFRTFCPKNTWSPTAQTAYRDDLRIIFYSRKREFLTTQANKNSPPFYGTRTPTCTLNQELAQYTGTRTLDNVGPHS